MDRLKDIERKITELSAADFQILCDEYLYREIGNNIVGLGTQTGAHKTTIGNPDTYIHKRDSDKYIFIAYSTQQNGIYNKLKEDIEKCLNPELTKLELQYIEEIICCHTSSNLSAGNLQNLINLGKPHNIKITIYGINKIALDIENKYKDLARDFLGISIDTNQIMDKEEFVRQYDANTIAAPLNTVYVARAQEFDSIYKSILENNITVVRGQPGVGKTRLVLEVCNNLSVAENYKLLCVKNNYQNLYEDLVIETSESKDYLIFVDDANELASLKTLLKYSLSSKSKIKLVITVRDYAFEEIKNVIVEYKSHIITVEKVDYEKVKDFLVNNLGINNEIVIEEINRIAKGNLRIAYLAGKLVKDNQSLNAISDVSQLFTQYYATYLEKTIGEDRTLCCIAGILALANVISLEYLQPIEELINKAGISQNDFKNFIDKLVLMEVAYKQMGKIVSFSDQCFKNYILYYCFIDKKLIDLSFAINIGFIKFREKLLHSLDAIRYLFSNEENNKYLKDSIQKVWEKYEKEKSPLLEDYTKVFHFYNSGKALALAMKKISLIEASPINIENIVLDSVDYSDNDNILILLSDCENNYFELAIELLIEFAQKSESSAISAFLWLNSEYSTNSFIYNKNIIKEKVLATKLSYYSRKSDIIAAILLERAKHVLMFKYNYNRRISQNTVHSNEFILNETQPIKDYREIYWEAIINITAKELMPNRVYDFLEKYINKARLSKNNVLIGLEIHFICRILKNLNSDKLRKLLIIHRLIELCKINKIKFDCSNFQNDFEDPVWEIYCLLTDTNSDNSISWKEEELILKNRISDYSKTLSVSQIPNTITQLDQISSSNSSYINGYIINRSINILVEELSNSSEKSIVFFYNFLKLNNSLDILPDKILLALYPEIKPIEIYNKIIASDFLHKEYWLYTFFKTIPEEMIDSQIYEKLITFLSDNTFRLPTNSHYRDMRFLDKFLNISKNIYVEASKAINIGKLQHLYFQDLFNDNSFSPEELLKLYTSDISVLQKIYFDLLKKDSFDQIEGKYLLYFIEQDDKWIKCFVDYLSQIICSGEINSSNLPLKALWESDKYLEYFDNIFDSLTEINLKYEHNISHLFDHILKNNSKSNIISNHQITWLKHIIEKHAHDSEIFIVFESIKEKDDSIRSECILSFLKYNIDYTFFEKLLIEDESLFGNESLIPCIYKKIEFLKSLIPHLKKTCFIEHINIIQNKILKWEKEIEFWHYQEIIEKFKYEY